MLAETLAGMQDLIVTVWIRVDRCMLEVIFERTAVLYKVHGKKISIDRKSHTHHVLIVYLMNVSLQ